jgi:uncharacterized protein (DUF486 family)
MINQTLHKRVKTKHLGHLKVIPIPLVAPVVLLITSNRLKTTLWASHLTAAGLLESLLNIR